MILSNETHKCPYISCCVAVTGLNLWGVLVATGAVCIIYCTLVSNATQFNLTVTQCPKHACLLSTITYIYKTFADSKSPTLLSFMYSQPSGAHLKYDLHKRTKCLCVIYLNMLLLTGRAEGSDLDRCVPDDHHVEWVCGGHRSWSCAAGGVWKDLEWQLPRRTFGNVQVKNSALAHSTVQRFGVTFLRNLYFYLARMHFIDQKGQFMM